MSKSVNGVSRREQNEFGLALRAFEPTNLTESMFYAPKRYVPDVIPPPESWAKNSGEMFWEWRKRGFSSKALLKPGNEFHRYTEELKAIREDRTLSAMQYAVLPRDPDGSYRRWVDKIITTPTLAKASTRAKKLLENSDYNLVTVLDFTGETVTTHLQYYRRQGQIIRFDTRAQGFAIEIGTGFPVWKFPILQIGEDSLGKACCRAHLHRVTREQQRILAHFTCFKCYQSWFWFSNHYTKTDEVADGHFGAYTASWVLPYRASGFSGEKLRDPETMEDYLREVVKTCQLQTPSPIGVNYAENEPKDLVHSEAVAWTNSLEGIIYLRPEYQLDESELLHELAHLIVGRHHHGHTTKWATIHLALLNAMLGPKVAKIWKEAYQDLGVLYQE